MQSSKPRSTIGERQHKAKSKPNSTNDRYESSARNNEKRKQRLPEFGLFRTMRECYPPPVRATTARILPRQHGALCSLPAAFQSHAREALAELCQMYWPPIYAYLRQRGFNRHDAQDLTQIFFQRIVQDETLRRASPARGRFRSFLLGALTRCLADEQAYCAQ